MAFLAAIPEVLAGAAEVGAEGAAVGSEASAAAGAEAAEGAAEGESVAEGDEEISKRAERRKGQGAQQHKTPHVTVTKTVDKFDALIRALEEFTHERVLVGVAADTAQRQDGGPINNATIGLIMERGSVAANIPARPWLRPGIMSARKDVLNVYLRAARRTLRTYNPQPIHEAHRRVGAITRDAVKNYIKTAPFTPLAASTVAARFRQRRARRRRKSETQYMQAVAGGMAAGAAQALFGIQPLINTGTFLNSVTFAVVGKSAKATTET